jgi:hypothetical protein
VIVGRRAKGAHEALPHTPPGDKPPETPGPLSLGIYVPERKESVKGSQAAQKPRALDRFLPFRRATGMRERGAPGRGAHRRRTTQPKTTDLSNQKPLAAATSGAVQQPQVLAAGPMAGFEVTLYGRICSDHRGDSAASGFSSNRLGMRFVFLSLGADSGRTNLSHSRAAADHPSLFFA